MYKFVAESRALQVAAPALKPAKKDNDKMMKIMLMRSCRRIHCRVHNFGFIDMRANTRVFMLIIDLTIYMLLSF